MPLVGNFRRAVCAFAHPVRFFASAMLSLLHRAPPRGGEFHEQLRGYLRQCPWWRHGHILLAQASLQRNDVASAYASAQAALKLPCGKAAFRDAQIVVARCAIARGLHQRARDILTDLRARFGGDPNINEELAAALLGLGLEDQALAMLQEIEDDQRSAEAQSMLAYLSRSKGSSSREQLPGGI